MHVAPNAAGFDARVADGARAAARSHVNAEELGDSMETLLAEVTMRMWTGVIVAAILIGGLMLVATWQSRIHDSSRNAD